MVEDLEDKGMATSPALEPLICLPALMQQPHKTHFMDVIGMQLQPLTKTTIGNGQAYVDPTNPQQRLVANFPLNTSTKFTYTT